MACHAQSHSSWHDDVCDCPAASILLGQTPRWHLTNLVKLLANYTYDIQSLDMQ